MTPAAYVLWAAKYGLPHNLVSRDGLATPIVWSRNASDKRIKDRLVEHIEQGAERESFALCKALGRVFTWEIGARIGERT